MKNDALYYKLKILEAKIDYATELVITALAVENRSDITKKEFYKFYEDKEDSSFDDGSPERSRMIADAYFNQLTNAQEAISRANAEYDRFKKEYFGD
jgi:hypothetical protein